MRETFSICGYTSISVDLEEDRDNTSIENQKAIIEDYVKRTFPGSSLDMFVDRDRSGYTFDQREQYQIMRRLMLRHQYDILIVKDLSRFSRRNGQGLVELEYLRDAGIRIIAIGDNIDYPTNDDWLRIQIYFFMNEMPVTDTSKKVRNVIKRRQEDGKWICNVPYGYYLTNTKTMTFEVDPPAADVVRTVFRLYNEGWGYKRIANWLTDQKIPTPRKTEIARIEARGEETRLQSKDTWNTNTIQRILDNDFYIGTLRQGKFTRCKINGADVRRDEEDQIIFEKHHEAIVDNATFSLTRTLREKRKRYNYRGFRKYDNVYSGLLFCADCGSPMFSMSRSDLRPAYICGAYHRRGKAACTSHHIRVDVLNETIKAYLQVVRNHTESMLEYLQTTIQDVEATQDETPDVLESLEERLANLKAELKASKSQKVRDCMRHPENAEIIEETYAAIEQDLANQISGIRNQILMNEDKQNTVSKTRRIARSVIEVFDDFLESETINKESLHLLIDKILVSEGQLEIKFKPDITALLQHGEQFFPPEAIPAEIIQASKNHTKKPLKVKICPRSWEKSDPDMTCGDPLEIYTEKDGGVVFRKYSPMGELADFAGQICDSLHRTTGRPVAVCDRDTVIAVSGLTRRELMEKRISGDLERLMESRDLFAEHGECTVPVAEGEERWCLAVAAPILSQGDVLGCVTFLQPKGGAHAGVTEEKLADAVSNFLGKQLES